MRYFVPTRIIRIGGYLGFRYPYELSASKDPLPNLCGYLASGNDYVEVDDPNYFFATRGREFNDCVHSKLVSYDGRSLDVPVRSTSGYLCLSDFKLAGGPWGGYKAYGLDYPSGVGTLCRSMGGWTYSLRIGKLTNLTQTDLKIDINLDILRADINRVARYGTRYTSTKTSRLSLTIHGEVYEEIWHTSRKIRHTTSEWANDPLDLDKSMLTSAVEALYDNYTFSYHAGFYCDDISIHEKILDTVAAWVEGVVWPSAMRNLDKLHNVYEASELTQFISLPNPINNFVLHEKEIIADRIDPYLVSAGQDTSHYFWNVAVQNAYLDALNSVPKLNDNSISNIIEIVGFIKALVIDRRIEIPKSLSDAWLSYRYQYTTGKLDAKEAIDFVHRHMTLGSLDKWIRCYGQSHVTYNGIDITCRCGLKIRPKDLATLQKVWRGLYTYGLQPNFYVIWDMIPYSFIVDWFLPVGKLASVLDAESQFTEVNYEITDVIFSFSYDIEKDGMIFHQYTRFLSPGVVTLNGLYFFEEDPVSTKVIGFRALDLLSLVLGRR